MHDPPDADATATATARAAAVRRAGELGAEDVLIFRRVPGGGWLHTGGTGRSAGWAGHVVEDADDEPLLARAAAGPGSVRVLAASPTTVVGPFVAGTAALVPVPVDGAEVVAVWGHPRRSQALMAATDEELRRASLDLVTTADGAGGPAERLAQELVVLHAVQEVTSALDLSPEATLARVARVLLDGVGAALAVGWADGVAPQVVGDLPDTDVPDPAAAEAAARPAAPAGSAATVCDDATRSPLAAPLGPAQGVVSYLAVPLALPGGGGLLVARSRQGASGASPVPFDALARRLAAQVARAAQALVQVALARRHTEEQLSATRLRLGQDGLTEAASRHRWEEEVARARDLVASGASVTVAVMDLDDLKWVNDTRGHAAGDAVLQACAVAVRKVLRGGSDVVARTGGDEFGVMVAQATDLDALAARLRSVDGGQTPAGVPLRVSVGLAQCPPGGSMDEALARADAAMYAEKQRRRAERGGRPGLRAAPEQDGAGER